MASRKLVRELILNRTSFCRQLVTPQQVSAPTTRIRLPSAAWCSGDRHFSVFTEFSKQVKGEAERSQEFQKSIKELKEKAEELKEATEDLKVRAKQTTEKLRRHVDGVWSEAEATAKKVKKTFGIRKQDSSESNSTSAKDDAHAGDGGNANANAKVSLAFQKLREAKPFVLAKKGYEIVKDELSGKPNKRKHIEYAASTSPSSSNVERSTRTDITVVPSKQSRWSKKWEAFKEKMRGHPIMKRVSGISEPVVSKSQDFADDVQEMWETSDNPVIHKIQDLNECVFGESDAAVSFKEIRHRDPSFSLPDFVEEVQEIVRPVLNAYIKGDGEVLKKYCSNEMIERCKAEHQAYESHGIFFDEKILHVSDVEVRETTMMGDTPIIIVAFQTQQVFCVRNGLGAITEGSKDTIHTVYYAWAMQQISAEEVGEGALYPLWRLREMQQFGVQALI